MSIQLGDWPGTDLLDVVKISPSYRLTKGDEYDFIPMEAVSGNFSGVITRQKKVYEGQGGAKFKSGDTIFAKITPCTENGKVAFINTSEDITGFGSTEFLVFSAEKKSITPKYLYRLLTSHPVHSLAISRMEGTTGRQRVPKDAFKGLSIPLPPLPEQRKIAEILTAVDDAIEKTDAIIKETQRLKKGLTQKLFTEGIGHTRFKEMSIGWLSVDVPQDWEISNLLELSTNGINNGVFNDPKKVGQGYRLINVKDMYSGSTVITKNLSLLAIEEKEFKRNQVKDGDIFFTRSSLVREGIGFCNIFLGKDDDITYDGHIMKVSPDKSRIYPQFLNGFCGCPFSRKFLISMGKTTTMTTMSQTDLGKLPVPIPPLKEQQEIASILSEVDTRIENEQATKTELEQLKKGLSQVLLTGKVRVKS